MITVGSLEKKSAELKAERDNIVAQANQVLRVLSRHIDDIDKMIADLKADAKDGTDSTG